MAQRNGRRTREGLTAGVAVRMRQIIHVFHRKNTCKITQLRDAENTGVAGFTVSLDRRSPRTAYPRKKVPPDRLS